MGKKLKLYKLTEEEAKMFYVNACSLLPEEIENRKNITEIAKNFNISISFHSPGGYRPKDLSIGQIKVFEETSEQNKTFIRHLRNAFCHLYIEIKDGICSFIDWDPYDFAGKKCGFAYKRVKMAGIVPYKDLESVLIEFISERSLKK